MIEAKMKEQAIEKLYIKYPELNCLVKLVMPFCSTQPTAEWVEKKCKTCVCCNNTTKKKKLKIVSFC